MQDANPAAPPVSPASERRRDIARDAAALHALFVRCGFYRACARCRSARYASSRRDAEPAAEPDAAASAPSRTKRPTPNTLARRSTGAFDAPLIVGLGIGLPVLVVAILLCAWSMHAHLAESALLREWPLAPAEPTASCAPLHTGALDSALAVGMHAPLVASLAQRVRIAVEASPEDAAARALTAAHVLPRRVLESDASLLPLLLAHAQPCIVVLLERDNATMLTLYNPVLIGVSRDETVYHERDPLCRIDVPAQFRRSRSVTVEFWNDDGALAVRRFDGAQAVAVAHALDVLAARQVCTDGGA